jgi:hypothetical protein
MLRLLIDENFDQRIVRALRLRLPGIDHVIVQNVGLGGVSDPDLLAFAARENRITVTHDVNTVPRHASDRLRQSLPMPGVIVVPENLDIGRAVDDLEIVVECTTAADLVNQIQYLPL